MPNSPKWRQESREIQGMVPGALSALHILKEHLVRWNARLGWRCDFVQSKKIIYDILTLLEMMTFRASAE